MIYRILAIFALTLIAMPAKAGKNDPFAMIQDPMAQAVIKQYLEILKENPELQQKVTSCAVNQISQNPEAQKILMVNPDKLQHSVQQKKIDLKTTLMTIKSVFKPCLDMMNNSITIE